MSLRRLLSTHTLFFLTVAFSTGCGPSEQGAEAITEPVTYGATTDGLTALVNLSSQIDGLEAQLARRPTSLAIRGQLVDRLLTRAQMAGTYDDFDRIDTLTAAGIEQHSNRASAFRARASFLSATHRFVEALATLDLAEALDGDPSTDQRDTIRLALGQDLAGILERRRAQAQAHPGFDQLASLAGALAAVGQFEAAEQAYRDALATFVDVSPFPIAWTAFQLGVMWAEEADDAPRAEALYAQAVQRLFPYVVARVHGAELRATAGEPEEAIALLEAVVDGSQDPEPLGLLAEVIADRDPERGEALVRAATERYDVLLSRHRAAFLDHGSEFFASVGDDPARALRLATENLELRQNDRAFRVAIEAALAAGDFDEACQWAADLAARPFTSPASLALVASLGCA